jgi:4-amino-4-deoxy-L-arabinose transferase-like glycosyltransferase
MLIQDKTTRLIVAFAALKFFLHIVVNSFAGYEIFRDELYYLACSDHPAMGYVDHPPLSIWLLKTFTAVFGNSLFAIRFLPALIGSVTVFYLGKVVKELAGRQFAVAVASVAYLISPINLAYASYFSMNGLDLFFWVMSYYIFIRIIKEEDKKLWVNLGIVLGLALLNKISMLFLGAGIFIALLTTRQRKWFKTKWPYLCGAIAFMLFSPYLIWNLMNDWSHLEFISNATNYKYDGLSIWTFLSGQFLINHPYNSMLCLLGLGYFLLSKKAQVFRPLAIIFLVTFFILSVNGQSKSEYLAGAITILFAGGAMALETWVGNRVRVKVAILLFLGSGLLLAPLATPVLSEQAFISYSEVLGISKRNDEGKEEALLPQFFADMHGWEQKAKEVSAVYALLTPKEKEKTVFFGSNYGQAGCIDYYRDKYELPPAVSGHNSYWNWGPGSREVAIIILLDQDIGNTADLFETVEEHQIIICKYCMPYENNLKVYVCRNPKQTLQSYWQGLKNYN